MVGGNFNVIASTEEKRGGAPPSIGDMADFNEVLQRARLSMTNFDGSPLRGRMGTSGKDLIEY